MNWMIVLRQDTRYYLTPMSKDNWRNRNIKPKLEKVGLGWANFLVIRRTRATLMNELGANGKLVAAQLGHSLDVSQNVYTQSPAEVRLPAVNILERSLNGTEMEQNVLGISVNCRFYWSGRPGSNRRHSAWEADVPLTQFPDLFSNQPLAT